jgi:hypothetical protein
MGIGALPTGPPIGFMFAIPTLGFMMSVREASCRSACEEIALAIIEEQREREEKKGVGWVKVCLDQSFVLVSH